MTGDRRALPRQSSATGCYDQEAVEVRTAALRELQSKKLTVTQYVNQRGETYFVRPQGKRSWHNNNMVPMTNGPFSCDPGERDAWGKLLRHFASPAPEALAEEHGRVAGRGRSRTSPSDIRCRPAPSATEPHAPPSWSWSAASAASNCAIFESSPERAAHPRSRGVPVHLRRRSRLPRRSAPPRATCWRWN